MSVIKNSFWILIWSQVTFAQSHLLHPDSLKWEANYIETLIKDIHPQPFMRISEKQFHRSIVRVARNINHPMTRVAYSKALVPVIAALGDGHTRLGFPIEERQKFIDQGGKFLPLVIDIIQERIVVTRNLSDFPGIQTGWHLKEINGMPAKKMIKEFRAFSAGERPEHRDWISSVYFQLLYWLNYGPTEIFRVTLIDHSGHERVFILNGIDRTEFVKRYGSVAEPIHFKITDQGDNKFGYLNISTFAIPLTNFLDSIFTKLIPQQSINTLIIDIRENGGGDSRNVTTLASYLISKPVNLTQKTEYKISNYLKSQSWFPEYYERVNSLEDDGYLVFPADSIMPKSNKYSGKMVLLTSHKTYSGAVWLAALIKCHALGTIVGEPTGGLSISPGDTYSISLPYSKLTLGISPKIFTLCCGKENESIMPDVLLPYSPISDWKKIVNEVLDLLSKPMH